MIDPRPVELPLIRDEVLTKVRDYGPNLYEQAIRKGVQNPCPQGPPDKAGRSMADRECQRVSLAELFYVSGDMLRLAVAAEASLPGFALMPEDLPADFGFIVFEQPLDVVAPGPDEHETAVCAASWGRWHEVPSDWPHGGLWITWYIDTARTADSMVRVGKADHEAAAAMRGRYGCLMIELESPQPFSPEALNVWDQQRQAPASYQQARLDSAVHWVGVLKTIWLLMGQTIGQVETVRPNRAALRRMMRARVTPAPVRVITLRRLAGCGSGDTDREYHHQWIVRGHWRQQWYASRQVHRPVWIAPHIKGPEGAPLLGGEKVYALQR